MRSIRHNREGTRMPATQRLLLTLLALSVLVGRVAQAQSLETSVQGPFRFEFEEVTNHRGPAVEGYLYNGLPWRIGDVRVRIESLDPTGQVRGEAYGWALGDSPAGGRAFFTVPITVHGATYRVSVDSFDKVSREEPQSP
jgi:hypothetical protein